MADMMKKNPMPEQAPEVRKHNFEELRWAILPRSPRRRPSAASTARRSPALPAARSRFRSRISLQR